MGGVFAVRGEEGCWGFGVFFGGWEARVWGLWGGDGGYVVVWVMGKVPAVGAVVVLLLLLLLVAVVRGRPWLVAVHILRYGVVMYDLRCFFGIFSGGWIREGGNYDAVLDIGNGFFLGVRNAWRWECRGCD